MKQCLPTVQLQNWTINVTIPDCDGGQGCCFLRNEATATDVSSCLHEFLIHDLKPEVKHIAMYSDTCSGQNKKLCLSHVYGGPAILYDSGNN
jgi:hypothetical protein